jgi:PEP-CTERM motif
MKKCLLFSAVAGLFAMVASAGNVSYDTTASVLSCNGLAGCVQDTNVHITIGTGPNAIVIVYNSASAAVVTTPPVFPYSNINLGTLDITCAASCGSTSISGLLLTLKIFSNPPGTTGFLPTGSIAGAVSISSATAAINFGAANTTSALGTFPGVLIGPVLYQVTNSPLALVPPTSGGIGGLGETSIQGLVQDTPEPSSILLLSAGLGLAFLGRRRASK